MAPIAARGIVAHNPQTPLVPVIGYIRVSAWFEEKISDELQKAAIEESCRRKGRTVVRWIIDLDATGRNFKRRIMEAISAVESATAEGAREIWLWKYSRFGRNRHGVAINLARVEQAGGQLISATEDVDATTATGRFTRGMLFEIAAFESDRIGEQWRETHEYRRIHGLPATGGERFGYIHEGRLVVDGILQRPESYEPDPATAEALVEAYRAYSADGIGFMPLAKMLNSQGIHNPAARAGTGWSQQSLIYYMDSGFPAGLLHVHRSDITCPQRAKCPAPTEHYGFIPGGQPAILSDEMWAAYRERREQRKRMPPRARIALYPFSGFVKCGLCSGGTSVFSAMGRRGYGYRCTSHYQTVHDSCAGSSVPSAEIETEVLSWLGKAAAEMDRRFRGSAVRAKKAPKAIDEAQSERITSELARLQKALDRASMASAMGDMPRDSYLRIRDELVADRGRLEAQLVESQAVEARDSAAAWEARGSVVRRLLGEWDTLQVGSKRDLLSVALTEIRIWPTGSERRVTPAPREGFVF
ncbi:recombinase family protein [Streptacidiphilus cavernicola]|uniref:Recombinase family protein n=1 Tax=Streptacidiphilus cavernicola TaxID=3342716 RepID=A0ABV6W4H9_9ACTN